ncbi:hypothetical protein HYU50_00100 [Candidatus Woesearchaeota archaeon]|nr:hypothetical protein [Candidatus Woesearchaeota archaeon]
MVYIKKMVDNLEHGILTAGTENIRNAQLSKSRKIKIRYNGQTYLIKRLGKEPIYLTADAIAERISISKPDIEKIIDSEGMKYILRRQEKIPDISVLSPLIVAIGEQYAYSGAMLSLLYSSFRNERNKNTISNFYF